MRTRLVWKSECQLSELLHVHHSVTGCNGFEATLRKMAEEWIRDIMLVADREDSVPVRLGLAVEIDVPISSTGMAEDRTPRALFALMPSKERDVLRQMTKEGKNHGK